MTQDAVYLHTYWTRPLLAAAGSGSINSARYAETTTALYTARHPAQRLRHQKQLRHNYYKQIADEICLSTRRCVLVFVHFEGTTH